MKIIKVVFLLFPIMLLFSCGRSSDSVSIAQQYGLAYAPVQIMKDKGFLEDELKGKTEVKWIRLANTAAIREGVLAGDVDAGFLGIPPFLIAIDQGMPWKLLCGISQSPLGLAVPAGRWANLEDIPLDVKIALPQPGSIQHILLAMALKREMGDASYFDKNLQSLKHPDGLNALVAGSVDAHFTSPPYIFMEEDMDEFEVILKGEEAMGSPFTFIVSMVTDKAVSELPDFPAALIMALERSMEFMETHPDESLQLLSEAYNIDKIKLADYMNRPGMIYGSDVLGLEEFISFMAAEGYLENISDSGGIRIK
ncbi:MULTISPECIES: ABC transporter substrate-binding protein [unclassified Oceanispirochaeta]|uniref:ABC transporter substrate-binding protein n=1 Tax=unclassified Oceanispirochaeta TaxID=2635722 RepID=UPI000E097998|nr:MULTISPECIES: ABC transporter substrate-binding protein [unclassified Oceanispirochaeta]MBF9014245.1 ABC transporter substrate-binding protein [Oceanispirochaeta sp. M2]NPD71131.1 ABC transporter substrate-binding protein [Oceanispirochaeta sp. M1]RDG33525.1 ABC transporter substrate-binding protein [Oceanispirochaeta sp. M1]